MLTVKEIKEKITSYENIVFSGGGKLSGRSVEVKNIKILKRKVLADVILHDSENDTHHRMNKCEYPILFFKGGVDDKRLS
jgi:hypothetical protein